MKSLIKIIAIALLSVGSLEAKGPSSSSSSSRSMSSSSSRSYTPSRPSVAPSKPYSAPAPRPTVTQSTPSKPNTSVAQTSTRPTSNVDNARYKAAVQSGKTFQTRDSAVADFKATKASTYTSRYASEPATRPQYIPNSYRSNDGHTYNITYNQSSGGYGYWGGGGPGLGTFIMYDMMSDAVMMNSMMARDNYYVGSPPVANTTTYVSGGASIWSFIGAVVALGLLGVIVFAVVRNLT